MKSIKWMANVTAAMLAFAGGAAHALVIGFSPVNQIHTPGQTAAVNVVISGLTAANQVVSGFSIDVSFSNSPPVSFVSGSYSSQLGDPNVETILLFDPISAAGSLIEMGNLSLLSDTDLDALQGDSVVLGTLRFRSNVAAQTVLTVTYEPLDITGRTPVGALPDVLDPDTTTATITWRGDGTNVPEPGTLLLLAPLLGWFGIRRRESFR